ncbi:MAG: hypothetical protein J6I50_05860 [Clostridia bacterium]|nr:hypothetical protein [Clostridia bacterium]
MENEIKFRSTIGGGYKKEDVNEYIASMQAQFTGIEETLKNTIDRQKESLDALHAKAEDAALLKEQNAQLQNALDSISNTLSLCKEELEAEKNAHSAAQKQMEDERIAAKAEAAAKEEALQQSMTRCKELEEQNSILKEQLSEMQNLSAKTEVPADTCAEAETVKETVIDHDTPTAALADSTSSTGSATLTGSAIKQDAAEETHIVYPEDYEALKLKAEQYDRMSAHVGAIMLKANANAEEILHNARAEAEKLLSGVNAELSATRVKAQSDADTLIEDIHTQLSGIQSSCSEAVNADLAEIRAEIDGFQEMLARKCQQIDEKIGYAKREMDTAATEFIHRATAHRVLKK